ncbi:MAG TPA: tubulin-like doman-containing protein [Armatimonadota bacterium]|nr:tubulin-like doman-containing protein [Armatimonadota bacterium]
MTDSASPASAAPRSDAPESGARPEALAPVSRSIIIGLGGTGHQVLLDVRRRIIDKYGSLKNLPIVNFIEIDTDEDVNREQGVRDDDPPEVNLQSSEKLHANIGDVQNLEDNLQQYPHIASWLDRNALLRGKDVQHGAGAIRARGRLALFRNYDRLQVMLEAAYKRIADPRVMDQCQQLGLKVSQSVTVYVVGSLLGGTCSGMFLDMAYIAGRLIPGNPEVIGIFSIPPIAGGRPDHRANAYAALLELNHYCYPHTEFTAQYTPAQQGIPNRREPFSYCYLVGMSNGEQQLSSVQDQVSLVGHSIFLDLTSEFQAQKRSNRNNFDQFLIHSDGIGCPQSYMSFGLSTIHFPKDKVISACAFRLAAETIDGWLSAARTYSDNQLHTYVTDRLSEMKLLPGDVSQWLKFTQDGSSLDSIIDQWRESLNEELVRTRPPANHLQPTISQHDQGMQQQNLRDGDPNQDLLKKNSENLGLYLRQVQRNLTDGLKRAPVSLEGWIGRMVDDPHYRQSTARAALEYARQLFTQAATGIDQAAQQNFAPAEPAREQAKDQALQKLHADSGSLVLRMVPGAYADTINQDRTEALNACSFYYRARLDTLVARHAARFFQELPAIVDRLIAELDAYLVKLDHIRSEFKAKEQETIASPVFVNGERLWDRDNDVNTFYQTYATPEKKENVSAATIQALSGGGQLYHIRKLDDVALRRALVERAADVFSALGDDVDVLTRFFQKYPDNAKRLEAIRQVYRLSNPFVNLKPAYYQSADDFVALEGKRQTVIGVHNGAQPGTPQEVEFRKLLDQVVPLTPEKFAMLNNRYETLVLREAAAFPLRLLQELDTYRQDYEFFTSQGATQNPLHTRKDVGRWEPINVPGSHEQDQAWETFAVGWGSGIIQDTVDRIGRVTFTTAFRDEFGMPVDRTVGQLLSVGKDLKWEADESPNQEGPANPRPPMEAHDIILNLCQDKTLLGGVRRGIESRIVHLGGGPFASALAAHAEEQKKRELSFYEAYRLRLIRFMTERNLRPDAAVEGQPARVDISPSDAAIRRDGSILLTARVYDSFSRELPNIPITWSARPNDLGMVDARGVFRALAEGEVVVSASAGPVTGTAHVNVSQTAPLESATIETGFTTASANGQGSDGVALAAPAAASLPAGAASGVCVCGSPIEHGFTLCPSCGKPFVCRNQHPVKPSWKRCPFCGDDLSPRPTSAIPPRECPNCKTPLEPIFTHCPECGAEVGTGV